VVKSRLFPLIFFDYEENYQYLSHHGLYRAFNPKIPINANLVDLTLSFNYEFDFWGKNYNLFKSAMGQQKAQVAETAQIALMTTTAVAQAYFALKTNLLREQLYEELYTVRKEWFELQRFMQEKALFSALSPLLSEENLLEAEKLVFAIKEEVETDKHLINVLLGVGPDEPLDIDDSLPSLPQSLTIPETLSLDLLSRRPDLMAQVWRVEALAHEVGAAKADFFPNINLSAFTGVESVLYRFLFNSHSTTGGLQPALHLPIFTAGSIRANIRAKKAAFDAAVEEYNQLILQSTKEVADLLVLAESIFKQKNDQEQIVEKAKDRYAITALRNVSGLDNLFEIYARQEEVIEKELDNVTLLYNQYLATIKLIKALGGGYNAPELPLEAEEQLQ
jgi:NodT family efflux transporter outer membrane factor (OMF) lipoprotein